MTSWQLFLHWATTATWWLWKPSRQQAAPDGTAIRDALYGVNYDGVTGNITFDQTTGDANKDMAYIKKAADGAFEFVKTQSVEG